MSISSQKMSRRSWIEGPESRQSQCVILHVSLLVRSFEESRFDLPRPRVNMLTRLSVIQVYLSSNCAHVRI
jgi:hypothetical protein